MSQSENINELAAALAKAQGEMRAAEKNCVNPHFKNRFADLSSIWDAIREPLSKNGLSIVQRIDAMEGRGQVLVTILMHSSGQWIDSIMPLMMARQDSQGFGSSLTYAKRYSLSAIIGVSSDDDDDGNAAVGKGSESAGNGKNAMQNGVTTDKKQQEAPNPSEPKISQEQLNEILEGLKQTDAAFKENFSKYMQKEWKVDNYMDLPKSKFEVTMTGIKRNIEMQKLAKGE